MQQPEQLARKIKLKYLKSFIMPNVARFKLLQLHKIGLSEKKHILE